MDYYAYITSNVIASANRLRDVVERIDMVYLDGHITETQREELVAAAEETCMPDADLPGDGERIKALELRCAGIEGAMRRHGWIEDEAWPLVTGTRFSSADQFRHTGDRVSMLLDGEETVRHYVCKLNDRYEEKGTSYTPLGNPGSWKEFALDAADAEISAFLEEWRAKFPGFTGWANKPAGESADAGR